MGKYKVITLCGSTKFKDKFLEIQKKLTLEGNIVLTVGLFGHSGDNEVWTEGTKEMLDDMHLAKIDMSDEIFVINVDGYIGESTKREIGYAVYNGKVVKFLEPCNTCEVLDIKDGAYELYAIATCTNCKTPNLITMWHYGNPCGTYTRICEKCRAEFKYALDITVEEY